MQAVLCGYYGYGNGGDEALLATLLQFLPAHIAPVVLSGNPAQTQALHGVPACDRKDIRGVLTQLRQSQLFIWGGGSLIQDATSAFSPWYYCGLMLLAQRLGLQTIAWAQGIGPLHRRQTRWIARQAFRGCDAISVRDRGSLVWLQDWGLTATVAPDPVWALTATPVPDSLLSETPLSRVAVVLRSHPQLTPDRLQTLTQALQIFQQQSQTQLLLVPFQQSQDLAIAQQLQAQLPDISELCVLEDPRQLKGLFTQIKMAIAMRLHGLIMAAAEGCQCFGISYDPKVERLLQEIKAPGWNFETWPTDATDMAAQWLNTYEGEVLLPPDVRKNLRQQAQQHQAQLGNGL